MHLAYMTILATVAKVTNGSHIIHLLDTSTHKNRPLMFESDNATAKRSKAQIFKFENDNYSKGATPKNENFNLLDETFLGTGVNKTTNFPIKTENIQDKTILNNKTLKAKSKRTTSAVVNKNKTFTFEAENAPGSHRIHWLWNVASNNRTTVETSSHIGGRLAFQFCLWRPAVANFIFW